MSNLYEIRPSNAQDKCVLLVESNFEDLNVVRTILDELELRGALVAVHNFQNAIDYLSRRVHREGETEAGVVMISLDLAHAGGRELLKFLSSHKDLVSLPVILLANSGSIQELEECQKLGASAYVVKPSDGDEFRAMLVRLITFWVNYLRDQRLAEKQRLRADGQSSPRGESPEGESPEGEFPEGEFKDAPIRKLWPKLKRG